jgi:hypothetical protein
MLPRWLLTGDGGIAGLRSGFAPRLCLPRRYWQVVSRQIQAKKFRRKHIDLRDAKMKMRNNTHMVSALAKPHEPQ